MNEQNINVSLSLVNTLFQYLGTRPYQEVFMLIDKLQSEVAPQLKEEVNKPNS